MSYAEAQATRDGILAAGLDPEKASVQINLDRSAYLAEYHRNRYQNDEQYRTRKQTRAREWQRRARAAARGDMTPWLTQD